MIFIDILILISFLFTFLNIDDDLFRCIFLFTKTCVVNFSINDLINSGKYNAVY